MNKYREEGGPGVYLGRRKNRKGADLRREHRDQQVEGTAEKTWTPNRRTSHLQKNYRGIQAYRQSPPKEMLEGVKGDQTWTERRKITYGKKQPSRLGIRSPGF